MRTFRHLEDFADLVLKLHYKGKTPERIVEIVKQKEKYQLPLDDIKRILSLHEKGDFE